MNGYVVRRLKSEINQLDTELGRPRRFAERNLEPQPLFFGRGERRLSAAFEEFRQAVKTSVARAPRSEQLAGRFAVEVLNKRLLSWTPPARRYRGAPAWRWWRGLARGRWWTPLPGIQLAGGCRRPRAERPTPSEGSRRPSPGSAGRGLRTPRGPRRTRYRVPNRSVRDAARPGASAPPTW